MIEKIGYPKTPVDELIRIGRVLFEGGLNNSHSGNMSVRDGRRIVITRRGAMLGYLEETDLVDVDLDGHGPGTANASIEVDVHRAVYRATTHLALIHTHPRKATAFSMNRNVIVPADLEGRYYFERVPVLTVDDPSRPGDVKARLPEMLDDSPVVVVRGHGAFAAGGTLEEALRLTHALEWSCAILMNCLALGMTEEELSGDRNPKE